MEDPFDPEEETDDSTTNEGQHMFRQKALSVQSGRLKKAEPRTAASGKKETRSKTKSDKKEEGDKVQD